MGRVLVVQFEEHAPVGTLGPPLAAHELCTWRPDLGEPAPRLADFDGILALGGVAHPDHDDQHPWLGDVRALLREAVEGGVPALGVCLGSQLLAQAAGGASREAACGEVGWHAVALTAAAHDDRLLAGLPESFLAFEWHHYEALPPDSAVVLGRSALACQAFRAGERAWGLQFHVEVDQPIIESWLAGGGGDLRDYGLEAGAVADESRRNAAGYALVAEQVAGRFGEVVAEHAGARAAA
jgi:GMP synthase-like glutamine amidotransferase